MYKVDLAILKRFSMSWPVPHSSHMKLVQVGMSLVSFRQFGSDDQVVRPEMFRLLWKLDSCWDCEVKVRL